MTKKEELLKYLTEGSVGIIDLTGADLSGLNLVNAKLNGAILTRANFTGTNLQGAKIREAIMIEANLTDTILWGADLFGSDLRRANFTRTCFFDAELTNTRGIPFYTKFVNPTWIQNDECSMTY